MKEFAKAASAAVEELEGRVAMSEAHEKELQGEIAKARAEASAAQKAIEEAEKSRSEAAPASSSNLDPLGAFGSVAGEDAAKPSAASPADRKAEARKAKRAALGRRGSAHGVPTSPAQATRTEVKTVPPSGTSDTPLELPTEAPADPEQPRSRRVTAAELSTMDPGARAKVRPHMF